MRREEDTKIEDAEEVGRMNSRKKKIRRMTMGKRGWERRRGGGEGDERKRRRKR